MFKKVKNKKILFFKLMAVMLALPLFLSACKPGTSDLSSAEDSSSPDSTVSDPASEVKSSDSAASSGVESENDSKDASSEEVSLPDPTEAPTSPPTPTTEPASPTPAKPAEDIYAETIMVGDPNFKPGTLYKGPVVNFRKSKNDTASLGTWWWHLNGIVEPREVSRFIDGAEVKEMVDVDMILDMLIANKVTEIYLDVGRMIMTEEVIAQGGLTEDDIAAGLVSEAHVKGFVSKCSKYGIRVAALTGASGEGVLRWIDPDKKYHYLRSFMDKIADYNFYAAEDEKFYAIHLDVEPHTTAKWETNRARYTQWMADLTVEARKLCDKHGLELEYDIWSWFREDDLVTAPDGSTVNIVDLMTDQCHSLGIMSYFNGAYGQYDRATKGKLEYAIQNDCRLIAGSETIKITPSTITYYGSTSKKFIKEQDDLRGYFDESGFNNFGGAIHHVYAWYALMMKNFK